MGAPEQFFTILLPPTPDTTNHKMVQYFVLYFGFDFGIFGKTMFFIFGFWLRIFETICFYLGKCVWVKQDVIIHTWIPSWLSRNFFNQSESSHFYFTIVKFFSEVHIYLWSLLCRYVWVTIFNRKVRTLKYFYVHKHMNLYRHYVCIFCHQSMIMILYLAHSYLVHD